MEQVHRNDPVGDLARDFRTSGSKATTPQGVRGNMLKHGCNYEPAWRALENAVDEWTSL